MKESSFEVKTDDLKLRIAEEEIAGSVQGQVGSSSSSNPADAQSDAARPIAGKSEGSTNSQSSASPSPGNSVSSDPDDLLDLILDPHAPEHEWMPACNELEKQNRRNERKEAEKKISEMKQRKKKQLIGVAALAAILIASLGVAGYQFHWGPFQQTQSEGKSNKHEADVDFGPYMKNLQHEIKSHWHPPKGYETVKIKMHFKVHKTGEITDVGFNHLSTLPEADAAALKSVIESMPDNQPLPAGAPDFVDIDFTFDYNVFDGKK